jgi:hypothetical protein
MSLVIGRRDLSTMLRPRPKHARKDLDLIAV